VGVNDGRKSPLCPRTLARRRIAPIALWALITASGQVALAPAASSSTLEVEASNPLPGFKRADLSRYLALHMTQARLPDWRFEPAAGNGLAADRVAWRFKLNPYAGGEVRIFAPSVIREARSGAHRSITIEARLYLNGEYQTLVEE
jgi:hypothetical protein